MLFTKTIGLLLAGAISFAAATTPLTQATLFVAGYDGIVRSVGLVNNGTKSWLTQLSTTTACGKNPSWLTLDANRRMLICLDEGFSGSASISTFDVTTNGSLTRKFLNDGLTASPVHAVIYNTRIFAALFGGAPGTGIQGGFTVLYDGNNLVSGFDKPTTPSSNPAQDVTRIHGIFPDPTEENLVAIDYGADVIRVLNTKASSTGVDDIVYGAEVQLPRGSGPRHAAFFAHPGPQSPLYLFVVHELSNTITTLNATYDNQRKLLLSAPTHVIDTFGGNMTSDQATNGKAAEIRVAGEFVIVSNRNSTIPGSSPPSDSLTTYRVNADGSLAFVQSVAAGGLFPRSFQINKAGTFVAIAAQTDSLVIVRSRDPATGLIGEIVASLAFNTRVNAVPAGLPAVIWNE